jgi:hypothetical protein
VVDSWNEIPDRVRAVAKSEKFQLAKTTGAELIPEKDVS